MRYALRPIRPGARGPSILGSRARRWTHGSRCPSRGGRTCGKRRLEPHVLVRTAPPCSGSPCSSLRKLRAARPRYLTRYGRAGATSEPRLAPGSRDERNRALEAHAFGVTAAAREDAAAAAPLLAEAFRLYRERRCARRAAVVALDIYDATRDDDMLAFATKHARRVPRSWLARRVATVEAHARV